MGYRITYDLLSHPKDQRERKWTSIAAFAVVSVLVISAFALHKHALPWIRDVLLPGDPDVTAAALQDLVGDLREGSSLTDAIATFCQVILDHGSAS